MIGEPVAVKVRRMTIDRSRGNGQRFTHRDKISARSHHVDSGLIPLDSRSRLINACRGRDVDQTPVWFMRQAGRIFPEYRDLRDNHTFMEICHSPELTSRVTTMPVERLGVDAAITFADIMFPLNVIDKDFELVKGTGPVIDDPIRTPADVEALEVGDAESTLSFFAESIEQTRTDLPEEVPLIGFAGAPFTLACYLIQGRSSRSFNWAREFMFTHPEPFRVLLRILTEVLEDYLKLQVDAGVDVLQLFDSWIGIVRPGDFRQHIQGHVEELLGSVPDSIPTIYFGTGTPSLLNDMADAGPDVLGVDWRIELEEARNRVEREVPMQGNLDPALMLAPFERITPRLDDLLRQAESLPGHIFNLGHGVHPDTPLDTVKRVIDYVRERTTTGAV
jgi:uroporphyrinogen decarboxylase